MSAQRPTRISVRQMRSDALHRLLASPRGRSATTLEEIPRLSELFSWPRLQIEVAIADLVHDGRLTEGDGRLVVKRRVKP